LSDSTTNSNQPPPLPSRVLVRRLLREHVRPHVPTIALALVFMALTAAATAALAKLMEPVLDQVFQARDAGALKAIGAAVLVVFVVKGLATFGQAVAMSRVGLRIVTEMQQRLFAHLLGADLAYFHDHATGGLIARLTNDVGALRQAVSNTLTSIGKDALTLVFLVALMFHQDWRLACIAFFAFPAAILPIAKIGRRMRKVAASTQAEVGRFTTLIDEVFRGVRVVKSHGMEAHEAGRARRVTEELYRLTYKAARVRSGAHPIMETLGGIAIVVVILYGGWQVVEGQRTTGEFFSFVTALLLAYEPMKRLVALNANLQEGLAAAQRVFAVFDTQPTVIDQPGAKPLEITAGAIGFAGVRFAYGAGKPALAGIDLEIPAGRTVALVGPSGAGKSTIMNLIARFYDVGAGRVTIDGTDVRAVTLASLRANIGLVSQEIGLFDDTVRANIAYGRPAAADAEIVAAARAAAADGFIRALPQGYDTPIGAHGQRLSGGQRQRLAIARAMLKNAPILLLDEATSALDTESERAVQAALALLMRGRTTLVIAHRLSTVMAADRIYVIEAGRVAESGTHAELMVRAGSYARLYALQFAAEAGRDGAGMDAAAAVDPADPATALRIRA
jgi:subfamily B ATP-binding cassette protein MsbA